MRERPEQPTLVVMPADGIPLNLLEAVTVRCYVCRRSLSAADAWLDRADPRRAFCDPCYYTRFGRQPWLPLWAPARDGARAGVT
jgi:hypothetical protein